MASADVLGLPNQGPAFNHVDTITTPNKRQRTESNIPDYILKMSTETAPKVAFEPEKHLSYVPPERIWSMEEIGMGNKGISPNAVSEPFSLFTEEAVAQMRAEILSKPVLENCGYSSNLAHCQLRGFAPK